MEVDLRSLLLNALVFPFYTIAAIDRAPISPLRIQLIGRQGSSYEAMRTGMYIAFDNLRVTADRIVGLRQ